jgi:hypothetical protein
MWKENFQEIEISMGRKGQGRLKEGRKHGKKVMWVSCGRTEMYKRKHLTMKYISVFSMFHIFYCKSTHFVL